MATLKKYNISGKEVGEVAINGAFLEETVHSQLVKDYLVALRNNLRQWSASTKGRSEVKHTTRKPHRQKGTGSARQGSLVAPQYRGGGIVFGPKPKFDQHVRMNRKEKKKAVQFLFGEKIRSSAVFIVEDSVFGQDIKKPRTKEVVSFLKALNLGRKKILFVGETNQQVENDKTGEGALQHANFQLSMRNIPRTEFRKVDLVNGYDLIRSGTIVITESALNAFVERCAS